MSGRVTTTDRGAKDMLRRAHELAGGMRVKVGILDDAPKDVHPGEKPSSLTLVEIAATHEFGSPEQGIPQRSFIRATIDEHRAKITKLSVVLAKDVLTGKRTAEQALDALGAKVAGWMQKRIADGIPPQLKPETLKRKTVNGAVGDVPLVDTGQLKSSIAWLVEKGVEG